MPSLVTPAQWKEAAQTAIPALQQSKDLKDLIAKFEVLGQRETPASLEAVNGLVAAWEKGQQAEVRKLTAKVADLKFSLKAIGDRIGVEAPNPNLTHARGYTFSNDHDGEALLPQNKRLPALTQPEIARINESIARAKLAVELARDEIIQITKKSALTAPLTQMETLFVDYFGAYDKTRATKVLERYKKLCVALTNPEIIDQRNYTGSDCFAFAECGNLPQGGRLKIWLCRDFFDKGKAAYPAGAKADSYKSSYDKTSDATLGTMIHEASHGTWDAADAPIPLDGGGWNPGAPDANGDSPDNDIQASTRPLDKKLAAMHPTVAIQNADNYGQFATEVAIIKKK